MRRVPVDGARCTGGVSPGCAGAPWVGSDGVADAAGETTGSSGARRAEAGAGSADGVVATASTGAGPEAAAGSTGSAPPPTGARCANSSGAPGRPFGGIGGSDERKATGATTGRAPTVGAVVAGARWAGVASDEAV